MRLSKRSFTLIELIVVIMIIGILASTAVSTIRGVTKKAILTEAVSAMGTIRSAERCYYVEHGFYNPVNYSNDF